MSKGYIFSLSLLLWLVSVSSFAQSKGYSVKGVLNTQGNSPETILVQSLTGAGGSDLHVRKGKVEGSVNDSVRGLCRLLIVNDRRQAYLPVFLDGKTKLNLSLDGDGCLTNMTDADNRALSFFNRDVYRRGRQLWMLDSKASEDAVKALAGGYILVADSLVKALKPRAEVAAYLREWAYTQATAFWITRYPKAALPWGRPETVLDNAMALAFYDTPRIVQHALPKDSLAAVLTDLYRRYSYEPLRRQVATSLVSRYIKGYNYSANFLDGLSRVTAAVETYQLPQSLIADFKSKLSTVGGQAFPEGVELEDSLGRKFDFASLRGKYVYIDLWASWCVPCIKEVPSLLKLEEATKDLPVVYVSISLDNSREAWLKRMRSLNLKGIQLHDKSGKLAEALNIKGIPHFLIYDRNGRLLVYNAPRPSDSKAEQTLRQLP